MPSNGRSTLRSHASEARHHSKKLALLTSGTVLLVGGLVTDELFAIAFGTVLAALSIGQIYRYWGTGPLRGRRWNDAE